MNSAEVASSLFARGKPGQIHLIGLAGAGMKSLADHLLEKGWKVSGSDRSLRLKDQQEFLARGILAYAEHAAKNVPEAADLVVYSLAIPPENVERIRAQELGIPTQSYVLTLGQLVQTHVGIGVAGTHGKTSTSALLSWLLRFAGRDPAVICGGRISGETRFGRAGKDRELIAECCEFRQSFLNMHPQRAALLTVEPDHFDCYPDEETLIQGFSGFCKNVLTDGLLVVNADSPRAVLAARSARCQVEYFTTGCEEGLALKSALPANAILWQARELVSGPDGTEFELSPPGENVFPREFGEIEELPLRFFVAQTGQHQVNNAVAAMLLARSLGVGWELLRQGLTAFPGVERRFCERESYHGWRMIDDYAHHPTEIRATLQAARQKFPGQKLVAAFQAHQVLRTQRLMPKFVESLLLADQVLILPIFAARENQDGRIEQVARELVERVNFKRPICEFCPSLDHLRSFLDDNAVKDADSSEQIFLALGAGDIDRIFYELSG